eukprot:TRINITY_DN17118_c0_g1_i2.p1 TRINITY_DN17118_c0_g1~~TRINITY_DN17118_c0_g1_i2.p1  ORF type:complete len:699 (-),score=160.96 TRINITY_DN17118_c0_g1_i2:121-2184(-)
MALFRAKSLALACLVGAASQKEELLCPKQGGFHVGDQVIDSRRGSSRLVCRSKHDSDMVGMCGDPYTGHSAWEKCEGIDVADNCGDESLWFARCEHLSLEDPDSEENSGLDSVESNSEGTQAEEVTGERPKAAGLCGCSWNVKAGCVVSAAQMMASLTNADMVGPRWCGSHLRKNKDALEDCDIRREVFAEVQAFKKCLHLGPRDCADADECQWASQGSGQCGIDEEQLLVRLVGVENRNHPLVQMVMTHDHCSKHSEEWCEADGMCSWTPRPRQAVCDVHPDFLIRTMTENPSLVLGLMHSSRKGLCSRLSEDACTGECAWKLGSCDLKPFAQIQSPLEDMVQSLCTMTARLGRPCPDPCVTTSDNGCEPPDVFPWSSNTTDLMRGMRESRVMKIMALMSTSSILYERECVDKGALTCKASDELCDAAGEPNANGLSSSEGKYHSGPGMKGIIKTAAKAVAEGKAGDFLEEYLENNPDKVKQITDNALDRLSSLLVPPGRRPPGARKPVVPAGAPDDDKYEDEEPAEGRPYVEEEPSYIDDQTTASEKEEMQQEAERDEALREKQEEEFDEEEMERMRKAAVAEKTKKEEESGVLGVFNHVLENKKAEESGSQMLLMVIGGVVLAMTCAAFAFGALCHAGLLKPQAREPLLLGPPTEGIHPGQPVTRYRGYRDQEMEMQPAMMRPS